MNFNPPTFMKFKLLFLLFLSPLVCLFAQQPEFTRQDTLRGSITPERAWWKLQYYHLTVAVHPEDSSLSGTNLIRYEVLDTPLEMQIDLQPPMRIDKVLQGRKELGFRQDGNAWYVQMPPQAVGQMQEVEVHFSGQPTVAARPPWDGGLSWDKDKDGNDWIVTTCQGDGASLWWPCKDHLYEEPDSMLISVNVPDHLMDVSNGRLREVRQHRDGTKTFHWFVSKPISNYVINLNIGNYKHFSEVYEGEKGPLDCDYYVLPYNLEKAKKQFKEVPRMFEAFEHWFGPYPFYQDGYKLVDVPYPGMEHQSSVTYGNYYKNGYRGRDVSQTGIGFQFDFIIVHESGHEWFANNITYKDIADMWIHESFTAYSENLFVDYHFGKAASGQYARGTRANINHDRPVQGPYDVNHSGSGDMYPKGANMLHTLRQLVDDDEKWRAMLRGMNETFAYQTVNGQQIEDYLNAHTEQDLSAFFDQYLRDIRIPVLEYTVRGDRLVYRWSNCVSGFDMPIRVTLGDQPHWLTPRTSWTEMEVTDAEKQLLVDPNFLIAVMNYN